MAWSYNIQEVVVLIGIPAEGGGSKMTYTCTNQLEVEVDHKKKKNNFILTPWD